MGCGWSHNFKKYGRKKEGYQQYRCTRCGRVKRKKVSSFMCFHQFKWDRRRPYGVLTCKKCGSIKDTRKVKTLWT